MIPVTSKNDEWQYARNGARCRYVFRTASYNHLKRTIISWRSADGNDVSIHFVCQTIRKVNHAASRSCPSHLIYDVFDGLTRNDFLNGIGCSANQRCLFGNDEICGNTIQFERSEIGCIIIVRNIDVVCHDEFQSRFDSFAFGQMALWCQSKNGSSLVFEYAVFLQSCKVVLRQRTISFARSHEILYAQRQEFIRIILCHLLYAFAVLAAFLVRTAMVERGP